MSVLLLICFFVNTTAYAENEENDPNIVSTNESEVVESETETEIVDNDEQVINENIDEELISDAFSYSVKIDDVRITVEAPENTFPNDSQLSVEKIENTDVDEAINELRNDDVVVTSYTYDIKILDNENNEIQPANNKVTVSFEIEEVKNSNLDVQVYHVDEEFKADSMDTTTTDDTVNVETESFSYYTVEFTYKNKTYVLDGDSSEVPLIDILNEVDLNGTIENVEVSNDELIYVGKDSATDEWFLSPLQPFQTTEWLKVTLDGIEYQITLTDTYEPGPGTSTDLLFAKNAPIATMTIDQNVLGGTPGVDILLEGVSIYSTKTSGIEWDGNSIVARNVLFQNSTNTSNAHYSHIGKFTLRYKNAVILSDGKTRKDLLVQFDRIHIAPRIDTDTQEIHDIRIATPNGKTDGNNDNFLYISTKILTPNNKSRAALRVEINAKVDGVDDETYFFTAFGFNKGNYNGKTDSNNKNKILYWNSNRQWVEQLGILSGINKDSNVYVANNLVSGTTIETFSDKLDTHVLFATQTSDGTSNSDKSYISGEVTVANGNELKLIAKGYYPYGENGLNSFLFPDRITHNYTSSSGYYGKIELNTEGYWKIDGSLPTNIVSDEPATLLYGGRYVKNANVDEKRTYDVPYGKDVTYKMTPENGYIIDKLYIDGKKIDRNSQEISNFKTYYNPDGSINFYTYKFNGDTNPGDLNKPDFDPTSEKGGSAHTIHVTWQPTVDIDFKKKWNDDNNFYGIRPTELPITLLQDGIDYCNSNSKKELFFDLYMSNIYSPQPYNLSGSATENEWQYKLNGKTMYRNLPMYKIYDEVNNTGTFFVYSIKEDLGSLSDYYIEKLPHTIIKKDSNDGSKRVINYTIENELKYTDLVIEKEVIGGNGVFTFNIKLENNVIKKQSFDGFSGVDGVFNKTMNENGNRTIEKNNEIVVSTRLLPNSEYTITEKLSSNWKETDKSKGSTTHSGKIYDSSNVYAYKDVNNGKLYIPSGSSYVGRDGKPIELPKKPDPKVRYFDDCGIEIEPTDDQNIFKYKDGDLKTINKSDIKNLVTITYDEDATVVDNNLVYKATKTGDNGITEKQDIILAKPVYNAWFENKKDSAPYNPPKTGD